MPFDCGRNSINLTICPTKLSRQKDVNKYQKNTLEQIINAIDGIFNSDGGVLTLRYNQTVPKDHVEKSIRKIEQKIKEFLGVVTLVRDINITHKQIAGHGEINIDVKTSTKTENIVTVRYNLYLPSKQHVLEVLPSENVEKVKAILMESIAPTEPTQPGTHHKDFVQNECVSFSESKRTQFKKLKDTPEKRSSFAKRLVGSSNRFTCYVSAFANYGGGYMYIGIKDNGIVEGERLTHDEMEKTKSEIDKVIKKMVWPNNSEPEERREIKRYQVHFEPVKDSSNNVIPSLYVVVVFVAQCPGGVFTAAPESYEIVNNEVKEIDFSTWKRRFDPRLANEETPWDKVYEMLTALLNDNCTEQKLNKESTIAQEQYKKSEVEVKLTCMSKRVSYYLRRRNCLKAEELLMKYKDTMMTSSANPAAHFKILEQYLFCVMKRGDGAYEASYEIAKRCLDDLNKLPPSLVSLAFYVQIATLEQILGIKAKKSEDLLCLRTKAEENYGRAKLQLRSIQGSNATKAEFKQKIYIHKALLYLGSSITGDMLADTDELIDVEKAKHLLSKTQDIPKKLSKFREIQYLFAQSCLSYRLRMRTSGTSHQAELLEHAMHYAKKAKNLAKERNFVEMENYAHNYINFFAHKCTNIDRRCME